MPYVPAKLTGDAYYDLYKRLGQHSRGWSGLIGYDAASGEAITADGSRRQIPPCDIIVATSHTIEGNKVSVKFADGNGIQTFKPYWL